MNRPTTTMQDPLARAARIGCALTGAWLFMSSFLWRHDVARMTNDALVGVAVVFVALGALYFRPRLHVINIALGVWVFASLAVIPVHSVATLINELVAGSLVFGFAVVPPDPERDAAPLLSE